MQHILIHYKNTINNVAQHNNYSFTTEHYNFGQFRKSYYFINTLNNLFYQLVSIRRVLNDEKMCIICSHIIPAVFIFLYNLFYFVASNFGLVYGSTFPKNLHYICVTEILMRMIWDAYIYQIDIIYV